MRPKISIGKVNMKLTIKFCETIKSYIDVNNLDEKKLKEAIDSTLGEFELVGEVNRQIHEVKRMKSASEVDKVIVSRSDKRKWKGPINVASMFDLFNSRLKDIEVDTGPFEIAELPVMFSKWFEHFKIEVETTEPAESAKK